MRKHETFNFFHCIFIQCKYNVHYMYISISYEKIYLCKNEFSSVRQKIHIFKKIFLKNGGFSSYWSAVYNL